MEKSNGKHSVNLNKTRVEKNSDIKNSDYEGGFNSKYGILIISFIFAIVIGILVYMNLSSPKDNDKDKSKKDKTEEVIKIDEEEKDTIETNIVNYVNNTVEQNNEVYYALNFESNGGTKVSKVVYESKEKTEQPNIPQKSNWIFMGWYLDEEFKEPFIFGTVLAQDTTVYAKWGKRICFKLQGESESCMVTDESYIVGENDPIKLMKKEDLSEDILENIGFNLENELGWYFETPDIKREVLEGDLLTEDLILEDSEDIILVLYELQAFKIDLYSDYAEDAMTKIGTIDAVEGRDIDFENANSIFSDILTEEDKDIVFSWYYKLDDDKFDLQEGSKADPSITEIYVSFDVNSVTYTKPVGDLGTTLEKDEKVVLEDAVTPDQSIIEANVEEIKTVKYTSDSHINLLEPEVFEGYEFDGWYLVDSDGNITGDKITSLEIAEDITVIGMWKKVEEEIATDNNPNMENKLVTE